jgi:hypothetical protein
LQPGRSRSHGVVLGNQRWPVAPLRSVEEPQPTVVALPRPAGSRQHCVVVLAWSRWLRWRHSVATCPESSHLHLGSKCRRYGPDTKESIHYLQRRVSRPSWVRPLDA